jgi:hypothetical protein
LALGLPKGTVAEWRGDHPAFRTAYVEAFRSRALGLVEEAIEIVDSIPKNASMARVQRERCRADLRRWTAARLVAAFPRPKFINIRCRALRSACICRLRVAATMVAAMAAL